MTHVLPAFPTYQENNIIRTGYSNIFGDNLKKQTRDIVRNSPQYKAKIETDVPIIIVMEEKTFQVDTFGAWAFGTPHYKGSIVFLQGYNDITLKVIDGYKDHPQVVEFLKYLEDLWKCYCSK